MYLSRTARALELLLRNHPFGQLNELVMRLARCRPQAKSPDQAASAAPHLERERAEADAHLERAILEDRGHSALLSRLRRPPVAIR